MGLESEALQDWHMGDWAEEDARDEAQEQYFKHLAEMESRYKDNTTSKLRTTIRCACCGKRIIKANYQTQFCSNKGVGNCKDKYWNSVSTNRHIRAKHIGE